MVKVRAPEYRQDVLHETYKDEAGKKLKCGYLAVNGPSVFGHKYQGHCIYAGKDRAVIDTDSKDRAVKAVREAWQAQLDKPTQLTEIGF
jgi:hypothetical protein